MSLETFVNMYRPTLVGDITSSDTSLVLSGISGLPTTGNCRIIIGSEILILTLAGSTTVTVARGVDNTSAAAHTSGAAIYFILTADALNQSRKEQFDYDVNSNRGTDNNNGRWFRDSDGLTLARYNGTNWNEFGWAPPAIKPPDMSTFTPLAYADPAAFNKIYTLTPQGIAQYLAFPSVSLTTYQIGALVVAVNTNDTVSWSAVVGIQANVPHTLKAKGGICIYEASSNKFTGFGLFLNAGALGTGLYNYTCGVSSSLANTAYVNSNNTTSSADNACNIKFYKIIHNQSVYSGGLTFLQSMDGINWVAHSQIAISSLNTMTYPSHVGFFADFSYVQNNYSDFAPGFSIFHWSYSEP